MNIIIETRDSRAWCSADRNMSIEKGYQFMHGMAIHCCHVNTLLNSKESDCYPKILKVQALLNIL
jgi:hypothetical protein